MAQQVVFHDKYFYPECKYTKYEQKSLQTISKKIISSISNGNLSLQTFL
jgi:hypothetical protein